jgi:integrase
MFRTWQERAGFDHVFSFHALRHSGITNVYQRKKDILLAQRVARHKSIQSTMVYASPSDQDVEDAMRDQPC